MASSIQRPSIESLLTLTGSRDNRDGRQGPKQVDGVERGRGGEVNVGGRDGRADAECRVYSSSAVASEKAGGQGARRQVARCPARC